MGQFEPYIDVRSFIETGGNVLLWVAFVTAVMWTLILERAWYFRTIHKQATRRTFDLWKRRSDHSSWQAHQIRRLLVSETDHRVNRGLGLIKTIVTICPMLGLLGTVTGMIEVFDVMAVSGSGNTRGMAGGVSKATLPTMAGMVAALSGMLFSVQLERYARSETDRVESNLEVTHAEPDDDDVLGTEPA